MNDTFFPALPDHPEDDERFREPPRDPRLEPPRDQLGAGIVVDEVIVATDRIAIIITSVRVYADGLAIHIERHHRRNGLSTEEWQREQHDFAGHWSGNSGREPLRWGLEVGDGERVFAGFPYGVEDADGGTYSFVHRGGGGGGGMDRQTFTDQLWLHPLPPAGPFEVVVQWLALGIPESRVVLDGAAIVAQAARGRSIWPGPTASSGGAD